MQDELIYALSAVALMAVLVIDWIFSNAHSTLKQ